MNQGAKASPKLVPLALSALLTFAPLLYFANHAIRFDQPIAARQVVEMRLLENLTQALPQPNRPHTFSAPRAVALPGAVLASNQSNPNDTSPTQATLPLEVVQPKPLNLQVSPKASESISPLRQSPIKQLVEEEAIKSSTKKNEKFATEIKNAARPDCMKTDHGLGLFNVVPLIYDIAKDKCK